MILSAVLIIYDLFGRIILPTSFSGDQKGAFHFHNKKNMSLSETENKLNWQKIKPLYSEACFFINTWQIYIHELNVV